MALRENYQDYIPNAAGKRYVISDAGDGQSVITDATIYDQIGDPFSAGVINATNIQVNKITPVQYIDTAVQITDFVSDGTYEDYPYRAAVTLTGVTENMIPEVVFGLTDAVSGVFAPVAVCYNGGIYLYAAEVPESDVTIPIIECRKVLS